ncbi:hypothetical protein M413DRAFT_449431 [Hebeloma cylindrosporum]|uniref:Uncharacterized protein n=1 Tax=Hebeloma cylindrosporum TaxID=76867 RepID=A0A0C2Y507_HEBCY|nr:hypothetical protein M413DRAFT_449431 [Hebeloma cylindrosporum h7]
MGDDMDFLGKGSRNWGLGVVHYAAGIEDVLDWIEKPTTTPAVLVPGNLWPKML